MAKMFECDQCDYKSDSKGKLTSHHNSLHKKLKYKCEMCGYQFSKKEISLHTRNQNMREGNFHVTRAIIRQLKKEI